MRISYKAIIPIIWILLITNIRTISTLNSYKFMGVATYSGCNEVFKYIISGTLECITTCLLSKNKCIAVKTNGKQCELCIVGFPQSTNINLTSTNTDKVYFSYFDSSFADEKISCKSVCANFLPLSYTTCFLKSLLAQFY